MWGRFGDAGSFVWGDSAKRTLAGLQWRIVFVCSSKSVSSNSWMCFIRFIHACVKMQKQSGYAHNSCYFIIALHVFPQMLPPIVWFSIHTSQSIANDDRGKQPSHLCPRFTDDQQYEGSSRCGSWMCIEVISPRHEYSRLGTVMKGELFSSLFVCLSGLFWLFGRRVLFCGFCVFYSLCGLVLGVCGRFTLCGVCGLFVFFYSCDVLFCIPSCFWISLLICLCGILTKT